MVIRNKNDAVAALICLITDFEMLRDGEWVPDKDSCEASITVTQCVLDWLKEKEN